MSNASGAIRPRLLALCGARSNNDVTKLQLANLGVVDSDLYDIFYLHGPIAEKDENNNNDNNNKTTAKADADHDVVDGLAPGPFYSWIDPDAGPEAMNEAIVNGVRLVLRVVNKHGPFETVYGFSNGGIIATLAANILEDPALQNHVLQGPSASPTVPISTKEVIPVEQMMQCFLETPVFSRQSHTAAADHGPADRGSSFQFQHSGGMGRWTIDTPNRSSLPRGHGTSNRISLPGQWGTRLSSSLGLSTATRFSTFLRGLFPRISGVSSLVSVDEHPFKKVLLACAGMSSVSIESITSSSLSTRKVGENFIDLKSIHLLGADDPMMPMSKSVADLFSEAQIIYLAGAGHSVGREERSNKDLVSSIEEFMCWSEEYDYMVDLIKSIYATVLDTDKEALSSASDFFELGGSSLDTISLMSQIEAKVGIQITQNEFFLNPKIKFLSSRCIEIKALSKEHPRLVGLKDSNEPNKWWPASGSQEQMIALWSTNPSRYNMGTTIEFTKELIDIDILRQAFKFVVEQQPTLRTVVAILEGNKFMQKVLPVTDADVCFELKVRSVSSIEEVSTIVKEESQFVFPLYDPPIVRGVVVDVANGSDFLYLSQYHVGSDSWALVILRKQILQAYMSIRSSGSVDEGQVMTDHPNFVDWTVWNRKCLHEFGQEENQLAYWRETLADLPPLALPLDKPRPSSLGSKGLQIPIRIDPDTIDQFKTVVTSNGANLYAGLLATYMLVLHCMGGGDDFAVGIALANRNSEGLHNLIGYFANEVSVRASFENKLMTFNEHLRAVRQAILGGMANADVPFHDVVKALNVPRDGRPPIFQAFFALQEQQWWTLDDICPSTANDNLHFKLKSFDSAISKFEVHMFIRENALGGVEGELTISTDLFNELTGQRLASVFCKLIQVISAGTDQDVPCLSYDIAPEVDKSISTLANDTATQFVNPKTSILDWPEEHDSQTALICHGGGMVTYRELKAMISCVHTYLSNVETKGSPVGLLVRSNPNALASIFGVISYGCIIVVVDPEKTIVERANDIFEDAGVEIVLVDIDFMDKFVDLNGYGFKLVSLDEALTCEPDLSLRVQEASPSSVFGYFYTSGTTGKPKGAIITHGNVLNLINWWSDFFSLTSSDRVLLFSSLSFIMSLRQYVPTLACGATVVLPSSSVNFESAIIEGQVNKLVCTPSALAVLNIVTVAPLIDAIQVAGEAPRLAPMKAWKTRVKNLYIGLGPTELCAHALCGEFDGETICIGMPAANVKAYVMNTISNSEALIGVPGELWVTGKNVSRGYFNRPELTAKHFLPDPMELESGLRCYKTGDMAKRLIDGRIQFLGRGDTQLKVNGYRMEASEILNALPDGLSGAHVMVRSNQLVLFKTPEISSSEVRSVLATKLPPYMVPKQFFTIDFFPLNKNRKLDVPRLIEEANLDQCMSELVNDDDEDEDCLLLENTISLVWSKSLGSALDRISPGSNFFEIGGTSLSAVLVARALSDELGKQVEVQDIFEYQTLRSLAKFLQDPDNVINFGDPRPLLFINGGRMTLQSYNILQGIGLILMSFVVFVPLIGTIVASAQSMIWFGNVLGAALIPAILAIGCVSHLLLVLLTKQLLIGKYKEGKAKVFSFYFLRWWLMRRILSSIKLYSWAFDDTFLSGFLLQLFGAQVGRNVSMESMGMLEPDLVTIGDDSVIEFEVNFNTASIQEGMLELRSINVGERVKLGTRAVLMGGSTIHHGSEVAPKSLVDYHTSTSKPLQYLIGSPAKVDRSASTTGETWMPTKRALLTLAQLLGCFAFLGIFTGCLYVGAKLAQLFESSFGIIGLILYMICLFSYIVGLTFLAVVALLKWILIPTIEEGKLYTSSWFIFRVWFMDRLLLCPAYAFSLQRSLETTSTYPLYLRALGADIGNKAWLTYITLRVGMEFLTVEDGVHTGMQTYVSTVKKSREGLSFHKTAIGINTSCGQRSIILSGAQIGANATVGAETCVQQDTIINDNETAFGSPMVLFKTSKTNEEVVNESLSYARAKNMPDENTHTSIPFWIYALVMNGAQLLLPAIIIGSYAGIYLAFNYAFGQKLRGFELVAFVAVMIPVTYVLGSMALMIAIKLLQLLFFGGKLSGTVEFYSVRFMCWYFLADMVYLCTSTFFVPFSGTELFCMWLRLMGSKVGKRVFFSPENGGLRELDFLHVGDDCHILTPNINSHYADHGIMQFYDVHISEGCEINAGATLMPLTEYGAKTVVQPYTITTKGQCCQSHTTYVGNPAKPVGGSNERSAVLFAGLGSAYPGMLKGIDAHASASALLQEASAIVGVDVGKLCKSDDPKEFEDPSVAQLVVTVVNIVSAEMMRQREPMAMSRVRMVAGFSVGEFAALHFAGAISFEAALKLVKVQCDAFAQLNSSTTLCNVRGLSRVRVEEVCILFNCRIANIISDHNDKLGSVSKNVYVCGGKTGDVDKLVQHVNMLDKASALEQLEGGKRTISAKKLRVNTANHTPLMKPAMKKFKEALGRTHIKMPREHLCYSNVTGLPYRSVEDIRTFLPLQMIKPVQWHSVIRNIYFDEGCKKFIECGAMRTQSSMVKLILKDDVDALDFLSSDTNKN